MSGDKTEQPTPKRLREAREKGDVCKSQDIGSALGVMAIALYVIAMGDSIYASLLTMTDLPMHFMHLPYEDAFPLIVSGVIDIAIAITLPVIALAMFVGVLANLGQTGVMFAVKAAMPKMENLSPNKWFGKVFSVRNTVEFLKNCIKVGVLTFVVWKVMVNHLQSLFAIPEGSINAMVAILGLAASDMLLMTAGAFCAIAALDYMFQRWQYSKQHMMSKEEVKQEYKQMEGDPQIKSKRKQLHQELLNQNTLGNVRKAKVLVTNPTHYAVALDYEKDKTPLPVILAKGEGAMAKRMIDIAREEGIPIMRNVPLARSLYAEGAEYSYIPQNLIAPVAEVLRWVQSLDKKS